MFYSHTFLAKKSPLGTVWIAAHLEKKMIKKPQIDAVDIPSYAESIMFPEVPIALRLSGHLLFGLVRIYKWKVHHLFLDCNRMLTDIRTSFASVQVNLPVDADRAPFESVTLPETFELDALELDASIYQADGPDNHCKTFEQITMTDDIQDGDGGYVAFVISEDNRTDSSTQPEIENSTTAPMEEDRLPPFEGGLEDIVTPTYNVEGFRDPGPSNQAESFNRSVNMSHGSQEFAEIEVMREAVHNFEPENRPDWDDTGNEHSASLTNRKASLSPILEGVSVSGGELLHSPSRAKAPALASADDPDILNTGFSFGQPLPDLQLQPSPLVKEKKPKKRKGKQFFDESIVLTNSEMKRQLEETSKLLCKRRKLPCSTLDVWKFRRTCQKERILNEPLLSGMSTVLQEVFGKSFPRFSVDSDAMDASSNLANASSHVDMPQMDMELEHPRFDMELEHARFDSHAEGILQDRMPSPSRGEDFTPFHGGNEGSVSDRGKTFETVVLPTFETHASSRQVGHEFETSLLNLEEEWNLDDTNVPEIPGQLNSADEEELNFLEASNASAGSETIEAESMSARTRAVAQYLKEHSPSTQNLNDESGKISLNRILEGKKRKQCARMFYETLVLKSFGLIDVQQEAAYSDILITPTPALSTAKF